jgi:hypothetical protein
MSQPQKAPTQLSLDVYRPVTNFSPEATIMADMVLNTAARQLGESAVASFKLNHSPTPAAVIMSASELITFHRRNSLTFDKETVGALSGFLLDNMSATVAEPVVADTLPAQVNRMSLTDWQVSIGVDSGIEQERLAAKSLVRMFYPRKSLREIPWPADQEFASLRLLTVTGDQSGDVAKLLAQTANEHPSLLPPKIHYNGLGIKDTVLY